MVIEELDGVVNGAVAGQQVIDIAEARAVSGGGEEVAFPVIGAPVGGVLCVRLAAIFHLIRAAAGIFPAKVGPCDGEAVIAVSDPRSGVALSIIASR